MYRALSKKIPISGRIQNQILINAAIRVDNKIDRL